MEYVKQEGGDHYQSVYQHWDWVTDLGMGYLAGCATKYVSRWWKKNGIEDLKKAMTYIDKIIATSHITIPNECRSRNNFDFQLTLNFVNSNGLGTAERRLEREFMYSMCRFVSLNEVYEAKAVLNTLIMTVSGALDGVNPLPGATLPATGKQGSAGAAPSGAQGTIGQGQPTNTSKTVAEIPFGPCPCGCGLPRRKMMEFATDECKMSSDHPSPFGYQND
jgi:hypothetical protein